MPAKSSGTAKSAGSKKGDFTYIIIYVLGFVTGIIFFILEGSDKRKKQHSIQAIVLGIIAFIVYYVILFIPYIGFLAAFAVFLFWVYGLYVGYEASVGVDMDMPAITDFAKRYI